MVYLIQLAVACVNAREEGREALKKEESGVGLHFFLFEVMQ